MNNLGLPVIDGYELAARLRPQAGWHGVPLAALTGYGQEHDTHRTKTAGFAAHLVEPVDLPPLESVLRDLAETRSSARNGRAVAEATHLPQRLRAT